MKSKKIVQENHLEREGFIHGIAVSKELADKSLRLTSQVSLK